MSKRFPAYLRINKKSRRCYTSRVLVVCADHLPSHLWLHEVINVERGRTLQVPCSLLRECERQVIHRVQLDIQICKFICRGYQVLIIIQNFVSLWIFLFVCIPPKRRRRTLTPTNCPLDLIPSRVPEEVLSMSSLTCSKWIIVFWRQGSSQLFSNM